MPRPYTENVRLRPKTSDAYYWKTDPAVAHIFNDNLSKLSVGVYKELVYGVGRSFWAFSRSSGAQRGWQTIAKREMAARKAAEHKLRNMQQGTRLLVRCLRAARQELLRKTLVIDQHVTEAQTHNDLKIKLFEAVQTICILLNGTNV
ncbi:MAG: hypothetical protein MMC23_010107 [Stictis urceolatum]|nr:hypothetical protein [Stictis urceolata]